MNDSQTYTLDDIVAISILQREVATKVATTMLDLFHDGINYALKTFGIEKGAICMENSNVLTVL